MSIVSNTEILACLQAAGVTLTAAGQSLVTLYHPLIEGRVKEFLGYAVEEATYTEYYPATSVNRWADGDPINGGYDLLGGQAVPRQRGNISRQVLRLREVPVRVITAVYENPGAFFTAGGTWPAASLLPTNAYYLDSLDGDFCWSGWLYRQNGLWSTQARTIKVTYEAGMSSAEILAKRPAIKLATLKAVTSSITAEIMKSRALGAFGLPASHSIKDFSMSYDYASAFKLLGNPGVMDLPQDVKQLLEPYRHMPRLI